MNTTRLTSLLTPFIQFFAAIAVTGIIWYGGMSVINGEMTAGALIAFLIYAINLANPVRRISEIYGDIQKSLAAADRVFETIDTVPDVKEKDGAVTLPQVKGEVTFDNVSFAYDKEHPALTDFNLEVRPGEVVALVGPSGAGKSTVANLLPRFYDVTAGRLLIDGIDVRDVTFAPCASKSASCRRRRCSLMPVFGKTSYTAGSTRRKKKSSRPPRLPMPTNSL